MGKVLSPFLCDQCPKVFSRKGDLTRHQNLHLGIKPYECEHCDKTFSQYSGLKTHENVHNGNKPHICGYDGCTAVFGDPSSCARHRKETHRRVGAYCCPEPYCNSRIKRRSAFAAHLRKHGIDLATIDLESYAPPLLPSTSSSKLSQRRIKIVTIDAPQRSLAEEFADHFCGFKEESPEISPGYSKMEQLSWSQDSSYTNTPSGGIPSSLPPSVPSSPGSYVDFLGAKLYVLDPSTQPSTPEHCFQYPVSTSFGNTTMIPNRCVSVKYESPESSPALGLYNDPLVHFTPQIYPLHTGLFFDAGRMGHAEFPLLDFPL